MKRGVKLPSGSANYLIILFSLVDARKPLTQSELSKVSGIVPQQVNYYIHRLVRDGTVITVEDGEQKKYTVQSFFLDEDLLDNTYKLMEHIAFLIRRTIDLKEVPEDEEGARERALINNLILFCAIFSRDVRDLF